MSRSVVELVQPQVAQTALNAVLTIAGSDSSGGAGIEADVKTITAHGAYALTCISALTAQNTMGVKAVAETNPEFLRQVLDANFSDFVDGYDVAPLKIVKTGMLTGAAASILAEKVAYLGENNIRLVLDPVMISTSGRHLVDALTMQTVLTEIMPNAFLCTPNFHEAVFLWESVQGQPESAPKFETVDGFCDFAVALQKALKCENLLLKGGHVPFCNGKRIDEDEKVDSSAELYDVLYEGKSERLTIFKAPRIFTDNSHGTGCTLASAISANLANGRPLAEAVALSVHYVHKGMVSVKGKLGHGTGPMNHTVEPPKSFLGVARGEKWTLEEKHKSFYEYLVTHPKIKESWKQYTQHPFLDLVATNKLPFDDFLYYLKQDYYYLVNYARVHGHAASVAPNCEEIQAQSVIVSNIMNEIQKHQEKLSVQYDIDYSNADLDKELQPGPACIAYCDYLHKIGREQDFIAIKVAVAPCLHGYAEAGLHGLEIRSNFDGKLNALESHQQSDVYTAWLDDYASDWYRSAHADGIKLLDTLFLGAQLSEHRKQELVDMFLKVTELEIAFWDEVVDRSKR